METQREVRPGDQCWKVGSFEDVVETSILVAHQYFYGPFCCDIFRINFSLVRFDWAEAAF